MRRREPLRRKCLGFIDRKGPRFSFIAIKEEVKETSEMAQLLEQFTLKSPRKYRTLSRPTVVK
jgi:hypothetical protein